MNVSTYISSSGAYPILELEMRNVMLTVHDVELVKRFFIDKLGYREREHPGWQGMHLEALDVPSGLFTIILVEAGDTIPSVGKIILSTTDCLRDFYYLKQEPFQFLGEPQYLSTGLGVDFMDRAGNLFMLLEERNY